MNLYQGLKSTDAEIIIDLEKGTTFFDYSFNKFGHFWDSQYCILSETGKLNVNILGIIGFIFSPIIMLLGIFVQPQITKNYQYSWQKFLKWYFMMSKGVEIQTSIGKCLTNQQIFKISCNIWLKYELSGDYKNQIKKIKLLRHFTVIEKNGITRHRQNGWDVVFDFKEPPQDGNLILKSIA